MFNATKVAQSIIVATTDGNVRWIGMTVVYCAYWVLLGLMILFSFIGGMCIFCVSNALVSRYTNDRRVFTCVYLMVLYLYLYFASFVNEVQLALWGPYPILRSEIYYGYDIAIQAQYMIQIMRSLLFPLTVASLPFIMLLALCLCCECNKRHDLGEKYKI